MQVWGCSRARDIFETPGPSSKKTTCSFSYRFRGSSGSSTLYQGLRVATFWCLPPLQILTTLRAHHSQKHGLSGASSRRGGFAPREPEFWGQTLLLLSNPKKKSPLKNSPPNLKIHIKQFNAKFGLKNKHCASAWQCR